MNAIGAKARNFSFSRSRNPLRHDGFFARFTASTFSSTEKMAKSKGNFYTLRDLLEKGYDALTIRYLLVSVRYRKQLNFSFDGLKEAKAALDRIKEFVFRLTTATLKVGRNDKVSAAIAKARADFEAALDDDLNTSGALAALFILITECNV